jgi:flagellar motor switch/type III secretory pathway protein FliN
MTVVSIQRESNAPVPYLLLGESARRDLTRRLHECIGRWRRDWAGEHSSPFRLELSEARMPTAESHWRGVACFQIGAGPRPTLMLVTPARLAPWLVGMRGEGVDLQCPDNETTLAADLEKATLTALARLILDSAGMQSAALDRVDAPTEEAIRELQGARYLRANVCADEHGSPLGLLISPTLASALLPARLSKTKQERIAGRLAAVAQQAVDLEAVLGTADLSVVDLARLAVGDVIVMNESLSEPGELRIRAGERIATVSAGRFAGHRAVQIKADKRTG